MSHKQEGITLLYILDFAMTQMREGEKHGRTHMCLAEK